MRILTVLGARPQFVKAAALSRLLRSDTSLKEVMVHTGQHFDHEMAGVFFEDLEIDPPDHVLGIHGGSHGDMTGRMLIVLEEVVLAEAPDVVVVYGDTNSTLAGAVVAAKLNIPLAHVEAGLRSFDRRMPEEVNRVLTDHVSNLLLCPTTRAVRNLSEEGITRGVVHVGDVMFDVALWAASRSRERTIGESLGLAGGRYGVVTVHRAANTDDVDRLRAIVGYLQEQDVDQLVWPTHPRVRQALKSSDIDLGRITAIEPIGYLDMARLLAGASIVFTDSGGLQKEAYYHRVPCVTLREETEWLETITHGWNRLWTVPEYEDRTPIDEYGEGAAALACIDAIAKLIDAT